MIKKFKKHIKILLGKYNQFYLNKFKKDKLTIFAFHDVNNSPSEYANDDSLGISKENFETIIDFINKNFNIISPKNINDGLSKGNNALITFDDGYKGVFENAIPILEKLKVPSLHFLNMEPIIKNIPNVSAEICYLSKYNKDFINFAKSKRILNPHQLNCNPELLKEFKKKLKNYQIEELNKKIKRYQGDLVDIETLYSFDQTDLVYYGNHFYNHWNTKVLTNVEIKDQYTINMNELEKFKNYINFFAFTNGKIDRCFNKENLLVINSLNPEKIFFSENSINLNYKNKLLDRVSIMPEDIDTELIFFKILKSTFSSKIKNIKKSV